MVCGETALAFLNRNRLLYLDMLEPIRRGTAELLYTESDGVLLYDRLAEAHMLGADTPQALERDSGKIARFARQEGLEAHARSVLSRFDPCDPQ